MHIDALCYVGDHYCSCECCKGCALFGKLENGNPGCLTKKNHIPIRELCKTFDCLEHYSAQDRERARNIINGLPNRMFNMNEVKLFVKVLKVLEGE